MNLTIAVSAGGCKNPEACFQGYSLTSSAARFPRDLKAIAINCAALSTYHLGRWIDPINIRLDGLGQMGSLVQQRFDFALASCGDSSHYRKVATSSSEGSHRSIPFTPSNRRQKPTRYNARDTLDRSHL
ncbi:hypothetical protein ACFX5Q_32935 [Mesorhizobium sp. IMUNJ 23033]|uniref:hypothetical protein n=1 Tax=Mesorhizobium sp. IMUNJ 23033 TaxID=3378039 RepID=UPI003850BB0A